MIQLGYGIAKAKAEAIEMCAGYVSDNLPDIPEDIDFRDAGFRALPKLVRISDGKTVMAHNEAGYFISKMCVAPEKCYDKYIDRLIMVKHSEEESGKSRFISVEDFSLSAMARIYALFYGKINVSEECWQRLKKSMLKAVYAPYFEPISENHKLCFLSSEFVCAQMFPDGTFYDGMDGKTRMPLLCGSIERFLTKRLRRGWSEYDSASYYEIDFMSLMNIFDFAHDEKLKKLASDCLNVMTASLYVHASNGFPAGPKGRVYPNVMENPCAGIYSVVGLGGEPGRVCGQSAQVTGMMYMATSAFMFDREVYEIFLGNTDSGYEVRDSVGFYTIPDDMYINGRIYKYFYKGDGYCMGSIAHRDNPYENIAYTWLCGHQEQAWSLTFGANARAAVYSVHPGNPQMHDYGMHGEWAGDANCLCQRFVQDKSSLLCYWDITEPKQLQYIKIYFPEKEFDFVKFSENAVIAGIGSNALRLDFCCGYERIADGPYKNRGLRINAPEGYFACRVFTGTDAREQAVSAKADGELLAGGARFGNLSISGGVGYIDGKPFDGSEYKLYNSPYLKSDYDSGIIELTYGGKRIIYNGR